MKHSTATVRVRTNTVGFSMPASSHRSEVAPRRQAGGAAQRPAPSRNSSSPRKLKCARSTRRPISSTRDVSRAQGGPPTTIKPVVLGVQRRLNDGKAALVKRFGRGAATLRAVQLGQVI